MNLSDKLFGSNVDPDVIEFFKQLQEGSFEVNPNQSINPTPYSNYLGDRIPFARMWTAVNIREMDLDEETQKLVLQEDKDSKNIIVVVNEHKNKNNYKELDSLDEQNSNLSNNVLKQVGSKPLYEISELQDGNPYLKPTAGITGINSKTEGAVGALRRTTIDFIVHNKVDFDTIFIQFFLRPGTTIFLDFGWADKSFSLYDPKSHIDNKDLKMEKFYENIYDSKDGEVAKQKGLMTTLNGFVTKYDASLDERGSFKCSLEIVSQNYSLLDKDINDDNDLKFLFTNVMDEVLVNYVGATSAATGSQSPSLDFDIGILQKLDDEKSNEFVKNFFDSPMLTFPGLIDSDSKKLGVFYQNLTGEESSDDYLDSRERLYIAYGLFEDLFLNNFVSWWEETLIEGGITSVTQTKNEDIYALKYRSQDSWVRYDENLFELQQQRVMGDDELTSFLYPDSWDLKPKKDEPGKKTVILSKNPNASTVPLESETYNKKRPSFWYDVEGNVLNKDSISRETGKKAEEAYNYLTRGTQVDKDFNRMPLRELFISVPVIQEAFSTESNINDVLENIFTRIKKDSGDIINILMLPHNNSYRSMAFQDANYIGHVPPVDEMLTFDLTSGNSVVLDNDLKFTTPKAGLTSMIAIKNQSSVDVFTNLDELKLSFFNVLEHLPFHGDKKIIMKSLPDIGFKPKRQKVININLRDLFKNLPSGTELGLTSDETDSSSERYKKYKANQQEKFDKIKEKEIAERGGEVNSNWARYDNLPTETEEIPARPIRYAKSYRHKKLMAARIKNFLQGGETSIAPGLPITLSLTIYGNNFLGIGEYITVNFLPDRWQDRVFFQITAVEHALDTNMWKTTYSTVIRIKPEKKMFLTGNQQFNFQDVVLKVHPLLHQQLAKERNTEAARPNEKFEELNTEITNDLGKIIRMNPKKSYVHYVKQELKLDTLVKEFDYYIGHKEAEFVAEEVFVQAAGGNITSTSEPGQELTYKNIGIQGNIDKNHFKLPGIGLNNSVKDEGQLAWLLAISDVLLSDRYLKWDEYADTIGDGDIENFGLGHFDIEMNSLFGMDDDISDIRRDTMSISPLFTGNKDKTNNPEVTKWTKDYLLDGFDDYVWERSEVFDLTHLVIDSVQRKIVDYINERKGPKISDYIKKRYNLGPKLGMNQTGAPLNRKPVLKLVVWGIAEYNNIWENKDGEIFLTIRCTNKNESDFQSVPALMLPKRILKETDYEKLTKKLYEMYLRHKVELKIITKLLEKKDLSGEVMSTLGQGGFG